MRRIHWPTVVLVGSTSLVVNLLLITVITHSQSNDGNSRSSSRSEQTSHPIADDDVHITTEAEWAKLAADRELLIKRYDCDLYPVKNPVKITTGGLLIDWTFSIYWDGSIDGSEVYVISHKIKPDRNEPVVGVCKKESNGIVFPDDLPSHPK